MAEMLPSDLLAVDNVTDGEKRVYQFLRDILTPHDQYIVCYEPAGLDCNPDFVVWSEQLGLLVIEVKDWLADQIQRADPFNFELTINGRIETRRAPLKQAASYANNLKDRLKRLPGFVHSEGYHRGKIRIPVNHAVFWANITEKEAENIHITKVVPANRCFYANDLCLDVLNSEDQLKFSRRLDAVYEHKFHFESLSRSELDNLRDMLFPKIKTNRRDKPRSDVKDSAAIAPSAPIITHTTPPPAPISNMKETSTSPLEIQIDKQTDAQQEVFVAETAICEESIFSFRNVAIALLALVGIGAAAIYVADKD